MQFLRIDQIKLSKVLWDTIFSVLYLQSSRRHDLFIIEWKKKKYFLKSWKENYKHNRLGYECENIKKLSKKIGPELLYYDSYNNFIITKFLRGKHLGAWEKNYDLFIKRVAWKINQLHSQMQMTDDFEVKKWWIINIQNNYERYIENKKCFSLDLMNNCTLIHKYLEENYMNFSRGRQVSFIHGDLNRENILVNLAGIHIIDWESARYDYPEIDLASFIFYFQFDKEKTSLLLEEYWYDFTNEVSIKWLHFFYVFHVFDILAYRLSRKLDNDQYMNVEMEIEKISQIISGTRFLI